MNKEFVPHELALKLKELGFDEPCFGYYTSKLHGDSSVNNISEWWMVKPLWQQAFDWFRIKHKLFYVIHVHREGYSFNIHTLNKDGKEKEFLFSTILGSISSGIYIKDYDEAKLRALEKLISLVKESK